MILEFEGKRPRIAADVYIAPTAVIIGDVEIGAGSSVWFGAVVRGDTGAIRIGERVSVQDNAVIHVNDRHDTVIGDEVTIGHGAVLEGCRVQRGVLVGMSATILDGAVIGEGAAVAAGTVVREGAEIPAGVLVAGVPAVVKGTLSEEVQARLAEAPEDYRNFALRYRRGVRRLDAEGAD